MDISSASDPRENASPDTAPPLLKIDAETCVACGLCVRACPTRYLTQSAPKTRPECVISGRCLQCGHCVAVCPTGAIVHIRMDRDAFQPVNTEWDAESVALLLRAKRSVRFFKKKQVPRELLTRLLDSAVCAPTNSNSQDRAFLVLTDRAFIHAVETSIIDTFRKWLEAEKQKGADPASYLMVAANNFIAAYEQGRHPVFHEAPCVIGAHSRADNFFGSYNCVAAMDYLMLHAHALGLGSCVIGAAAHMPKATGRFLGLADDRMLQSVIVLGYPDIRFKRTVSRRPAEVCWHSAPNASGASGPRSDAPAHHVKQ